MSPDLINGLFEFIGACFTLTNMFQVVKDRGYAGIYIPAIVFFMSWGVWNLYFYPHLNQWFSFTGGVMLVTANCLWIAAMVGYGKR